MGKTKRLLCYYGNIEDIKCSLSLMDPVDPAEIDEDLSFIKRSLDEELRVQKRKTVIKMFLRKIKKLERLKSKITEE